jgi:hypothetical protein
MRRGSLSTGAAMPLRKPYQVAALALACLAGSAKGTAPSSAPLSFEQTAGFAAGTRPARYDEMLAYLKTVASGSDRVKLRSYGTTPTGRKLWVLTISSPANLAQLDTIEAVLHRLGQGDMSEASAAAETAKIPLVSWNGYGIHGDEVSASDGALRVIERLVTGQDPETRKILDDVVVNIDPMVNPDGRERDLAHIVAFNSQTPVLDRQNLVHHEFWPEGRTNHYLFDLNRDALYVTQPQSLERVSAILGAMPQVITEGHEMRWISNHLLAVPAPPLNPYLPPSVHASWARFAQDIGAGYDAIGRSYYTRSWNEVVYPGYYDIMPAYHGATPLLFEQAGNSGVTLEMPSGKIRTYADTVDNQYRSSIATLASAADRKTALFASWYHVRHASGTEIAKGAPAYWVVPANDGYKLGELRRILDTQGVHYSELGGAVDANGMASIWQPGGHAERLPAGSLLIASNQPLAGIVLNIFEPQVPMDAAFLHAERERTDLGEATQLYDVTAWSLPLAYAMPLYWSGHQPSGAWHAPAPLAPAPDPGAAQYGYAFEDPSLFAAARLLGAHVRIRVATEAFAREGHRFPAGTLVIRNEDQSVDLLPLLRAESERSRTSFIALAGALTTDGPDLGDDGFVLLTAPKIALVGGSGVEPTSFGALWELFDEKIAVPVTLLDDSRLQDDDLSRYNVIILPDADDGERLTAALKGGVSDQLTAWVKAGGTLIVEANGAAAAAKAGLGDVTPRATAIDRYPPLMLGRTAAESEQLDFTGAVGAHGDGGRLGASYVPPVLGAAATSLIGHAEKGYVLPATFTSLDDWAATAAGGGGAKAQAAASLRRYLPHGAYLAVDLKPHHWLGFGAAGTLPALFREADTLVVMGGNELVARYADPRRLVIAGLVWPEAVGYIADTAYLARTRLGTGQIITFAGDPVFRGYSLGTQRLLLNAAVLGPGMRNH